MATTAEQVFTQIRTLVDDDIIDFTTEDYLVPKLQLALNKLVLDCLNNPNMGALKTVVEIPSLPAGTRTLSAYFDTGDPSGGPLATLTDIMSLRERPSSGTRGEQDWVNMSVVPDLPAAQPTSFNRVYVWTMDDIKLLGADQITDLRIFGKFTPQTILSSATPIPPNTGVILAYGAASIIGLARGNRQLGMDYKEEAKNLTDSLFANAIMMQQSMRVRMQPFRTVMFPFR